MTLGARLAEGRTAELYEWADGRVIKLYRAEWDRREAEYEAHVTRRVREAGFDAPEVGDLIDLEGRTGIVFERIDGPSMVQAMINDPTTLEAQARTLAELHAALHACWGGGLMSQRQRLTHKIRKAKPLTQPERQRVIGLMKHLEDGTSICHGDFHPENVILTAKGPRVLDWMDVTGGSPLADVARTVIILEGTAQDARELVPDRRNADLILPFRDAYLDRYAAQRPFDPALLDAWRVPIAAARLLEGIAEEQDYLLGQVKAGLR